MAISHAEQGLVVGQSYVASTETRLGMRPGQAAVKASSMSTRKKDAGTYEYKS
jgi:hypothetical protein